MKRLARVTRFVVILLAALMVSSASFADDSQALSADASNTIVLLLSQSVHSISNAVLDDHLLKWDGPSIRYRILAGQPSSRITDAISEMQQILNVAKSGLSFESTDSIDSADIAIVFDDRSSSVFSKYKIDLKKFYTVEGAQLDDNLIANLTNIFASDINPCVWFRVMDGFRIKKNVIFVSSALSADRIDKCINNALIVTLGLSLQRVEGHSVRSSTDDQSKLTEEDKLALEILYQPKVRPGDTIRQAIDSFGHIKVNTGQ